MVIPKTIQAGDTLNIEFTANHDEATFVPHVVLTNATSTYTKSGSGAFEITLTAAETAAYVAGLYSYLLYVTDGTDRYTIESGSTTVKADLTAALVDGRTTNRKILEAIEATLQGVATTGHQQTSINGKSISRFSPEELIKLHQHFKRLCKDDDLILKNGSTTKKIYVRFDR